VLKQDNTTPGIGLDTRDALVVFIAVSGSGKSFPPAVAPEANHAVLGRSYRLATI
jgi:hypothetical protein